MSFNVRFLPALLWLSVLALGLALLVGCGGGGGGGGGGNNNTPGTINEGYVQYGLATTTPPTLSPGDVVTLTASVTNSGVTTALSPYNFVVQGGSSVATVSVAGVLTAGSGVAAATGYTITATSSAGTCTWAFTGAGALSGPVVVGIVELSGSQTGISGATINAYDGSGNTIGSAVTTANGTFSLPVTTAATKFGVSISAINPGPTYYTQFGYGNATYATDDPACLAPLPGLGSGNHHYALPNPITLQTVGSGPPPPPPGCFG